jgi:hypothetical protein
MLGKIIVGDFIAIAGEMSWCPVSYGILTPMVYY